MDYKEAKKFMNDWLWESKARRTAGMPWTADYTADVISMIMEVTKDRQKIEEEHK